jgi:hypothetical protein
MHAYRIVAGSLLALALGGCASSPVVGTWTGRGDGTDAPFTFGSVSFVGDKTFTAEARYGGTTRVQSGTWETQGDRLSLRSDGTDREYTYAVDDGALVVTDPKSGRSITLDRMAK